MNAKSLICGRAGCPMLVIGGAGLAGYLVEIECESNMTRRVDTADRDFYTRPRTLRVSEGGIAA